VNDVHDERLPASRREQCAASIVLDDQDPHLDRTILSPQFFLSILKKNQAHLQCFFIQPFYAAARGDMKRYAFSLGFHRTADRRVVTRRPCHTKGLTLSRFGLIDVS